MIFLVVIVGLIGAVASISTVKYLEQQKDNTYGILGLGGAVLFCLLSCVSALLACLEADFSVVQTISVCVNIWMLLTTSYMDHKCGQFHLIILLVAILAQGVCLIISGMEINYFLFGLCLMALVVFCCLGFSIGDGGLYLCCGVSLFICYARLEYIVFMMLASCVLGLIVNQARLFRKNLRWEKFPFTTYIGFGCLIAYGVSAIERFTAFRLFDTLFNTLQK